MGRGKSKTGKEAPYGTEFHTVHQVDNIKFIKANDNSNSSPRITQADDRIYVVVGDDNKLKNIVLFDEDKKRTRQIDLDHFHNGEKPHVHTGYNHDGEGVMEQADSDLVDRIEKIWYDFLNK